MSSSEDGRMSAERSLAKLAAFRAANDAVPLDLMMRLRGSYLRTQRDDLLRKDIDEALKGLAVTRADGTRNEGLGLALLGASGSGKSSAIRRALSKHPVLEGFGVADRDCPALSVRCKGSYTLKVLGLEIARAAGYPLSISLHENVVWSKLRWKLRERGVVLLHIDEMNSLLRKANVNERARIVDMLKGLQNDEDWPIALILSGTPRVEAYIKESDPDGELWRRLTWRTFAPLQLPRDNAMIASHVSRLCDLAGLSHADGLASTLVPRLIHAARYQLGRSVEIAVAAVKLTLEAGDHVLQDRHFATAFARTGCHSAHDPFSAVDWAATKVFDPDEFEEGGAGRRGRRSLP